MDAALWLDVATRFGVPTAILIVVLVYHARVVAQKDAEISRINDLRVKDAEQRADKQLARDEKFQALLQEVQSALELLVDRLDRIGGGKRS